MHPTLRWILFLFFVLLFFIGAPALVLYTAGYRFNIESRTFLRTGVLSIVTIPRGARFTLNGELLSQKTPAVVKQLMPGKYDVLITREGYHPWQQTVRIVSGETTPLSHLLLLKGETSPLFSAAIATHVPHPSGEILAFTTQGKNGTEAWIARMQEAPILLERLSGTNIPELHWSSEGNYLLFFDAEESMVGVFTANGSPLPLDALSDLDSFQEVFWAPGSDHLLTFVSQEKTETFDVRNGFIDRVSEEPSIPLDASVLTFEDVNGSTEVHLRENTDDRVIALLPLAHYTVRDRDRSLLLLEGDNKILLLLDIRAQDPLLFKQEASYVSWDKTTGLIAISDGYEVHLYDTAQRQMEFLTRQSTPLVAIALHPSGSVLLLATENDLFAMEQKTIEETHPTTLLLSSPDPIQAMWISENGKTAFVGAVAGEEEIISALALTK